MTGTVTIPPPDFGRAEARKASIFVYARDAKSARAAQIDPPRGWRIDGAPSMLDRDRAALAVLRADMVAEGVRFEIGSPARVRVDGLEHRLHLTSDCLTIWRLVGPIDGGEGDALETALSRMERTIVGKRDDLSPRDYLELATSGYVNLTAFLENIWGPVASGDYRVWKRFALASTFVNSPETIDALLEIKGEDRFALWANERPLARLDHSPRLVPARIPLRLDKGWNRLRIASTQDATREWGGRRWGFEARLLTPDGAPLAGLQIAPDIGA